MNYLKQYKYLIYFFIYLIVGALLLTVFNMFFSLSNKANEIISLVIISGYGLYFGIKNSLKVHDKVLLSGFKGGIIHLIILYLLGGLVTSFGFTKEKTLYYFIFLGVMILGTMIGIKLKKE